MTGFEETFACPALYACRGRKIEARFFQLFTNKLSSFYFQIAASCLTNFY